ncbi:MAG: HAD-IC family P-type ATPase [Gemmatimonadetes bacterium]|nr:HAD-IC family P-type ATPase [Gemmatimonadota bacterium]
MAPPGPSPLPRGGAPDAGQTSRAPGVTWHAVEDAAVLTALDSSWAGLSDAEVRARRARFGRNELPRRKPPGLGRILLHQFLSPLIYVLLAAAGLALVLRDFADAGFIAVVVLLNAILGTWQEWKAERDAQALQGLLTTRAAVRRGGVDFKVEADELVPGDLVRLESGDRVPADLRLLRINGLQVDEAFLTGESHAVAKHLGPVPTDALVGDRLNMAFGGSLVMLGRGEGIVVATGMHTEVGTIADTVAGSAATRPPLVVRMERFARQTSLVVLGACVVLAVAAVGRGMPLDEVVFFAVALAVAAIPEGLPVAVTVALSIATRRMARRHVIVRRLTAVEGLGSCTCIASDKTGTLTLNRQTVRRVVLPSGETLAVSGAAYSDEGRVSLADGTAPTPAQFASVRELAAVGVLCNEGLLTRHDGAWTHDGDAIDVALLALGLKVGLSPTTLRSQARSVATIPFDSERGFAATLVEEGGSHRLAVKGALEVVLPRCRSSNSGGRVVPLDTAHIHALGDELASSGYRFIALAERTTDLGAITSLADEDVAELSFLGLVGLIDPPRPEARAAVARCHDAGVRVIMVTGDHPRTALAIARELGIAGDAAQVITGRELLAAGEPSSPAFRGAVEQARTFARVAPLQKHQIVEALQAQGHLVAVTGDGVNDAPALRAANIGVAMGSGSDVAKDTASLIVTDDNFASIEAGVEEGRYAYDNIRKVTYLLISMGTAEVLLFLGALAADVPLPLLPVQLLWLNLVTNGIQDVALAFEGGEPGAMDRPPRRPGEGIFNRLMVAQTVVSGTWMATLMFVGWLVLLQQGLTPDEARNRLLLGAVLIENFHVFNARSERTSAFRIPLRRNYLLLGGVLLANVLHIAAMHLPGLSQVLHVAPIPWDEWVIPIAGAATVIAVMEAFKLAVRRRWTAAA